MLTPYWYFKVVALLMIQEMVYAKTPYDLNLPDMEIYHDPEMFEEGPSPYVNGSKLPDPDLTPDWRLREPPWYAYGASYLYQEQDRPYRISPHYKQTQKWKKVHRMFVERENLDYPDLLGCYCTTVYKKFTVLAGCAVLTLRHILTTATSTELVIRDRHNDKTLENILGLWYDTNLNTDNSSMYATPARIHYHPKYIRPTMVNASHPLPFTYDLSVWATTYPLYWYAKTCSRANSGWITYGSTVPQASDIVIVVGFQYIRSLRKKPLPWYKYAVRTKKWVQPCPQKNWGWFHCLSGGHWANYGVESGAAWHRATHGISWLMDGLAGMCAFSLRLRSEEITHYFTVINTHPVLDFMYDAYMGRLPYEYLDQRFYDTQWKAPRPKPWFYIAWSYVYGIENYEYYGKEIPFYK